MARVDYRDTWAEVSLDAIHGNIQAFKKHIRSGSKMMAVVKADGYGHGAVEVANTAIKAGADYLAVALLEEALKLREAGIHHQLLVLGYTKPEGVMDAVRNDITLTVFTRDVLDAIGEAATRLKKKAKVHLKVDTGMTRIGVQSKESALELIEKVPQTGVEVEGIYTHFADADNPDADYTKSQFVRFLEVTEFLKSKGYSIPIRHCCNSAATICYPEMHLDMCRVGISIYGLYPGEHMRSMISLTQAMSFKTKSVYIKKVEKSQSISYGRTYNPDKDALIATLPVGYADGLSRKLSNRGSVTVKGERVPIVGRICMDQTMVNITNVKGVTEQDVFTFFGDQKEGFIPLDEIAEMLDTIHYEIVCLVGKRVPRVYVKRQDQNR